jgi:hypothetical protein
MYLRDGREADLAVTPELKFVAVVCLVVTLALGVAPEPAIRQVMSSSAWLFKSAATTPVAAVAPGAPAAPVTAAAPAHGGQ